jgi:2-phosphosulfolactate phosphatase
LSRPVVLRVFRSALDPGLEIQPDSERAVHAVIVDVLRATTSLIHAFAYGARSARAFATIDEARREASRFSDAPESVRPLLCGESGGLRVPGFDLGNSPIEYAPERVAGRDLLVATTNGAPAIHRTAGAAHQFLAAFVNLSACADAFASLALRTASSPLAREVRLVAAGKLGAPSAEDDALVGALAARLLTRGPEQFTLEGEDPRPFAAPAGFDPASGAFTGAPGALEAFLRASEHGAALLAMEPAFASDLADAADLDRFSRLPFGRGGTIGPGLDLKGRPDVPLF